MVCLFEQGCFMPRGFGNLIHCMFIFLCCHFLRVFLLHTVLSITNNFEIDLFLSIDETLKDIIISGYSEPGSNDNEGALHTLQNWSLTIRCNLVSYTGCTPSLFYVPVFFFFFPLSFVILFDLEF